MPRHAVFLIAILGLASPLHAQQRTDADEASRVGDVQRMQAAQFPRPASGVVATNNNGIRIGVGGDAEGACWATRGGKRVTADRASLLGPMWHGSVISVSAARTAPAGCLSQVTATLRSSGYQKLIATIARD